MLDTGEQDESETCGMVINATEGSKWSVLLFFWFGDEYLDRFVVREIS